jgi:hypothetical protein
MQMNDSSRYYCGSFLNVLGMYEHADKVSRSDVVTIIFPQDTENEYPQYTLVHELTHRDLVQGSLLGTLQVLVGASKRITSYSVDHQRALEEAMLHSVNNSRQLHEAIATYIGFIHQATTDETSVKAIYQRLPNFYRSALAALETVFPKQSDLLRGNPHEYRNILLALGKFCLNTRVVHRLVEITDHSVEQICTAMKADVPDRTFHQLIEEMRHDPSIIVRLLDLVRQTAVDCGVGSFNGFIDKIQKLSRSALTSFIITLDQRLMNELPSLFPSIGNPVLTLEERGHLVNIFVKEWNSSFEDKYGHKFTAFEEVKTDPNPKPNIRIMEAAPQAASGKRIFSKQPAPIISMADVMAGVSVAKSLGLGLHIRMFINPGDVQLPMGETAPPIEAQNSVFVFAPCLPDTIQTDSERARIVALMQRGHAFCRMHTSIYISNEHIQFLLEQLEGVPILWHIDWIMYNFAKSAKVDVGSFPGLKYIHMDNADDVTFFKLLKHISREGKVEAYVQYFGERTLLVATFYRVGQPIFYSIPIGEFKYEDLIETIESVGGHLLQNEEFKAKPFNYKNCVALLFHYGI